MIIGIQKRQCFLLLLVLAVPVLFSIAAIWLDVGWAGITSLPGIWCGACSPGLYKGYGIIGNPLPEIFLDFMIMVAPLGLLTWLAVRLSNRALFQHQRRAAKYGEALFMALVLALAASILAGSVMPLVWLPKFHDYLLGLPGSTWAATWSGWLVLFPTAGLLSAAMLFSTISTPTAKGKTP
jgi:hypothetical protein